MLLNVVRHFVLICLRVYVVFALLGFDMRLRDVLDYDVNDASRASESAATCKNACDVSRAASADCGVCFIVYLFFSQL